MLGSIQSRSALLARSIISLIFALGVHSAHASELPLSERSDVHAFIEEMVQKHKFKESTLNQWFNEAKVQPTIIEAMTKPAEGKPWHEYQKLFITTKQINDGVDFMKKHKEALLRAEKQFGVPKEIITAIIGVETRYGQYKGVHSVMDALITLSFDYPPRAPFFRGELEQYLLLAQEEGFDPNTIKGSYAGAMGIPQFIPSTYRRLAIDFSGKGKRDIHNDETNAIGSVANYFSQYGWHKNEPVIVPAKITGKGFEAKQWSMKHPKPELTITELAKLGVKPKKDSLKPNTPSTLVELKVENGKEYWIGLHNFYVITRYNNSNHYAMAVWTLSQELKAAQTPAKTKAKIKATTKV